MSKLTDELVANGFTAKLAFAEDISIKIVVVKNNNPSNKRHSLIGDLKQPDMELLHQNPTIKSIQDGVRFQLGRLTEQP